MDDMLYEIINTHDNTYIAPSPSPRPCPPHLPSPTRDPKPHGGGTATVTYCSAGDSTPFPPQALSAAVLA